MYCTSTVCSSWWNFGDKDLIPTLDNSFADQRISLSFDICVGILILDHLGEVFTDLFQVALTSSSKSSSLL